MNMSSFTNLSKADQKKLILAGGIGMLALVVVLVYTFGGGGAPSEEARSAQQEVLDKVSSEAPGAEEVPVPVPTEDQTPAGRPRAVPRR